MLWKGSKRISRMWVGGKSVAVMWRGAQKIFDITLSAALSCFGSGKWVPQKPWLGADKWKSRT